MFIFRSLKKDAKLVGAITPKTTKMTRKKKNPEKTIRKSETAKEKEGNRE
jgi:hypothetical protein